MRTLHLRLQFYLNRSDFGISSVWQATILAEALAALQESAERREVLLHRVLPVAAALVEHSPAEFLSAAMVAREEDWSALAGKEVPDWVLVESQRRVCSAFPAVA